ncbi:transposase domain-containing protein [Amycolatopsis sp. NPDC024027]|uniref:transposase domain-containing protein n=1 Tax=Amycolatopsis sp. NPDC024027 TaxID=3154327 RepID=UPI0033CEDC1D
MCRVGRSRPISGGLRDRQRSRRGPSWRLSSKTPVELGVPQSELSVVHRTVTVAAGRSGPGQLGELTQVMSFTMVDDVLASGAVRARVRDLPSRVVVWRPRCPPSASAATGRGGRAGQAELSDRCGSLGTPMGATPTRGHGRAYLHGPDIDAQPKEPSGDEHQAKSAQHAGRRHILGRRGPDRVFRKCPRNAPVVYCGHSRSRTSLRKQGDRY